MPHSSGKAHLDGTSDFPDETGFSKEINRHSHHSVHYEVSVFVSFEWKAPLKIKRQLKR